VEDDAQPSAATATREPARRGPRVIASDETNSLLIYADGEEYEFIRDALSRLDQPVPQVLIEAILAEVTLTRDLQYGVNFRALSGDFTGTNTATASGTPASVFPGFSVSWVGNSASAVLNSLQSRTNVRVLSAPKLVVLNNQTATLQVGDQVPIIVQQVQSVAAPGAPVVNNVELRDTGVILRVTPRVNDSGTVTLDISQEVSDVARTTTSGINSPTIQQRRIASVVATRSGEMVALGGLIRDRTVSGRSGIPLLSQIPILGGLFGNHSNEGSRTELIILLTPTVIRAPQDSQAIVHQLIDGLDSAGPIVNRALENQVGGHMPPADQP
jgi:general secretion pathway protein D